MNGNVWEYCSDYFYDWRTSVLPYGDDPYVTLSTAKEIMGYTNEGSLMVIRGGGVDYQWYDNDGFIGTTRNRNYAYSSNKSRYAGFRLAIDAR